LSIGIAEAVRNIRDQEKIDLNLASEMARLGSGSACRSIFPYASFWGKHTEVAGSSDEYGIDVSGNLHLVFKDYKDTILLVDEGVKSVSSTAGHALMNDHIFGQARIDQAFDHSKEMMRILNSGDLDAFVHLVELEALTLHALMMSASHPYLLMRPGTVAVIEEVQRFRSETNIPVCFTLDAGANVHLLFPASEEQKVNNWVERVLSSHCRDRYLCDAIGGGPRWKTSV
jgi:diphosphomevalonate decarboxylase